MKVSADPNSNNWVLKWGSVKITIDGKTIDPKDCCYAETSSKAGEGVVHIYERTKNKQILTVQNKPRATEQKGTVSITIGNNAGCMPCKRTSFKRRSWWKIMHLEK